DGCRRGPCRRLPTPMWLMAEFADVVAPITLPVTVVAPVPGSPPAATPMDTPVTTDDTAAEFACTLASAALGMPVAIARATLLVAVLAEADAIERLPDTVFVPLS